MAAAAAMPPAGALSVRRAHATLAPAGAIAAAILLLLPPQLLLARLLLLPRGLTSQMAILWA